LELPQEWKIHNVFHISKLTPFKMPTFLLQSLVTHTPHIPNEMPVIDAILDKCQLCNSLHYLIHLLSQAPENCKWLPEWVVLMFADPFNLLRNYASTP
ncbi:hypothetical protein BDN70DRAFT_821397, partial [Pholiota conissans]